MNTKYIIGGLVVAAAVVGAYVLMQPKIPADQQMTEQMENRMSMRHSLRDFMMMPGESMQCTYTNTDPNTKTVMEGTTYIASGKVRSDSTITVGTSKTTSSSIVDGDVMYAWGSAMPHGMKMSLSAMSSMSTDANTSSDTMGMNEHAADFDQQYDYSCAPWTADASFFAPPAGIQFMDYSEMMQNMGGMMQGGTDAGMVDGEMIMPGTSGAAKNAMMCVACEQAPDAESKAECKAAMGCQ